jgi:hypothetical protein
MQADSHEIAKSLSARYEAAFVTLLSDVAAASKEPDVPLVPFWPIQGDAYDRELLVIGRSVNGWVNEWTARQLADPECRRSAARQMRANAEPDDHSRMSWVADMWHNKTGYRTSSSAFWRVLRRIIDADSSVTDPTWPSRLAWTNLYKVAPAAGWNPGADLQRAQRRAALDLLTLEIEEFAPRRILALTGGWINPFIDGLGLGLIERNGLVEKAGHDGNVAWVVAKHPMTKPEDPFVGEVLAAFASLGTPIGRA